MTYYCMVYNERYCVIRRIKGYTGNMMFNGVKISPAEYKKLFYSTENKTVHKCLINKEKFDEVRLTDVNAEQVLGRPLKLRGQR